MKKPANSPPEAADQLADYRAKRSAQKTLEPFGVAQTSRPGLFVVHKHAATRLHYDLRLELGGVLVSFAIPKGPSADPNEKRFAALVENHPVEYADYEGVIPDGNYGAGPSIVWDRGSWVDLPGEKHGLLHGKLLFDLYGYKLRGRWTLVKTKKANDWLLIKKPDAFAVAVGAPSPWPEQSIYSGVDVFELPTLPALTDKLRAELKAAAIPRGKVDPLRVKLMLAERADEPFSRKGWIYELKYDGYRALGSRRSGKTLLRLRGGSDAQATFPELSRALAGLPYDCVVDGEIVALDERGHPSFGLLQTRAALRRKVEIDAAMVTRPVTLFAFDLLSLEGHDLRSLPLTERKAWLRRLLPPVGPIRFADHVAEEGKGLYAGARELLLEGVMAKRADGLYRAGRSEDWLKVRGEHTADLAVVGLTAPSGNRTGFGALHLASFDGEDFIYAGKVGAGFSEALLESLNETLTQQIRPTPAFKGTFTRERKNTWVEPSVVVEVAYLEWTKDGQLRLPRLLRVRDDRAAKDRIVKRPFATTHPAEPEPVERSVVLSNTDKLFWPEDGFTKGDLVAYYRGIAPWLLPYLKDRPVVLTRFPDGIHGKSFFQKDTPPFVPAWLQRVRIWSEQTAREVDHFVCNDLESLLYLANMGTIPLHVWASRTHALQSPDWTILDLDPKGAPFEDVVRIAKSLRTLCDEIELPSFVKTSGSSGLHVLIPLGGRCTFDEARGLAELLARVIVAQLPQIATIERVVNARGGKVYVDYLQNGHGKLLVSPFSVRPIEHAPVSMPLSWSEVNLKNHPRAFTIEDAARRMARRKSDPFAGVLGAAPDLIAALGKLADHPALKQGR